MESRNHNGELTLNTAGAVNFENLNGTHGAETIKGDANANVLGGLRGVDILYGYAGDDFLYAESVDRDSEGYYCDFRSLMETDADILYGGDGNDLLCGSNGENILDGGIGTDTMTGGSGVDTFIIRTGDGSSNLDDADTITDFKDGTDVIGLDNGLTFDDLTITQGTGDNSKHTIVRLGDEYLLIIQNIPAENLTSPDSTPVTIDESLH